MEKEVQKLVEEFNKNEESLYSFLSQNPVVVPVVIYFSMRNCAILLHLIYIDVLPLSVWINYNINSKKDSFFILNIETDNGNNT